MKRQRFSIASLGGLTLMVRELIRMGAMCPKCLYGTRATSKRWAKCKRCGDRIPRDDGRPTRQRGARK